MLDYRESRELWEWENLAPYAAHSSEPSLNWRRSEADEKVRQGDPIHKVRPHHYFPERKANVSLSGDLAGSLSRFKTAFQIDKERLTGSTAFRRLEYKTQVFVTHVGDHYRTRLTHVVEVNETARIIGQALRLNEDLIEAITLGHDLGHTPFGHAGEHTLYEMFKKHWPKEVAMRETEWGIFGPAFYHNVQSVRVVDMLEKGYEWDQRPRTAVNSFDNPLNRRGWGLDLTWAVREGILKHSQRGLKTDDIRMYGSEYLMKELEPFQPATIEGQVVEYADEITSIMHDLEDGLRYRLFTLDELQNSLMKYINQNNLLNLLGLSTDFGVKQDKNLSSRLKKLRDLLDAIEKKKDRTVGNVLALLRTILLSNLIETTSLRLRQALG
ncbi:MAG: dGTP triphosphohydrolase, partial [bacterium]